MVVAAVLESVRRVAFLKGLNVVAESIFAGCGWASRFLEFFSKFPGKVSVYAFFVVSRCCHVVFVAFKLHVLLVCGGLLTKFVIFGIVALFHSLGHAEAHAILHFPSW